MNVAKSHPKGFTLIELLVVIAIIALLSAVVISSLSSARVKGRNAARVQTVEELAKAFILASDSSNTYPSSGGGWSCLSTSCGGAIGPGVNTNVANAIAPYISKPDPVKGPSSPIASWGFSYNSSKGASTGKTGIYFPPGPYFLYPVEGSSCPIGQILDNTSYISANYTMCLYPLP